MDDGIHIFGLGAQCAIGRSAWSSAAAVRAGVSGFSEHSFVVDSAGRRMRVASAPWLDPALESVERFAALLSPALDEAIRPAAERLTTARMGLVVGLPEPRPGLPGDLPERVLSCVSSRALVPFETVLAVPRGHAAALTGLSTVAAWLREGRCDACVVAGVDSYLNPETLEWLEGCDQVHSAGPLNNAWGFVPGEAGAALLIAGPAVAQGGDLRSRAVLRRLGLGVEAQTIKTATVCVGEGLTEALRRALAGLPDGTQVSDIYADLNGEPYRADEYGFASVRVGSAFADAGAFVAPADCWGDVGAASGAMLMMAASVAASKGYSRGRWGLVWASSEGGDRAAVLMEGTPADGDRP